MVEVSTSLLSADKEILVQTIYDLEEAKTDYFHIDVMDGQFVERDTTNLMREYVEHLKYVSILPIDVHLMVTDVKEYVDAYLMLEPNIITFHTEACKNKQEVHELIKYIKDNNCRVGLAVKPNTNIEEIYEFIPYIHMVLVMTVEPGKGGQELIPETVEKIKQLKTYCDENDMEIDIEVDGGINENTVEQVKEAGANIIVVGTYILNSDDYKKQIKVLK